VSSLDCGHAMVAGTSGPGAIAAAVQVLKQGGSAADAVLAAALGQTALAAGCWVSYAGTMSFVYYAKEAQQVHALNATFNTVRGESRARSIPGSGGRTALTPGFMAGVGAAHARFGRLPFARLFEPAIEIAERGFVIDAVLEKYLRHRARVLARLPEARAIFFRPGGARFRQGQVLRQPQLAGTLRKVADLGADYIYRGDWAQKFVAAVAEQGGKLSLRDLEDYRVIWSEPLHTRYHGYDVFAPALPGLGGVHTIEALNLVECADLARHGPYTDSPEFLYWLIQIARVPYLGAFFPLERRATKETARRLWEEMRRQGGLSLADSLRIARRVSHSDGVVAVDADGNVAALCHSINTIAWGRTGIFVDGISIPDSAAFQQREIARAGPGNRLPEAMNPLIVLRDGVPFLASSCINYALHEETVQNLLKILDFGMLPKDALATPRFLCPVWPGLLGLLGWRRLALVGRWLFAAAAGAAMALSPLTRSLIDIRQVVEAGMFAKSTLCAVRRRGQRLKIVYRNPPLGYWAGVRIDPAELHGAATAEHGAGGAVDGY
jgi:gamma-glutamyltranspeptidase/glutathione hydrolase